MNVQEALRETLQLQALMKAAESRLATLKAAVKHEAIRRFEADGAAVTWRHPGLGTVTLAGVKAAGDEEDVDLDVIDLDALMDWCKGNLPSAIVRTVDTGVIAARLNLHNVAGDVATDDGEKIPGVRCAPGRQPYLSVRPNPLAMHQAFQELAGAAPPADLSGAGGLVHHDDPDLTPALAASVASAVRAQEARRVD